MSGNLMKSSDEPVEIATSADACVEGRRDFMKTMLAGLAVGAGGWITGPPQVNASKMSTSGTEQIQEQLSTLNEYNQLFKEKFKRCVEIGFHYHDLGQYEGYYSEILSKFSAKQIVGNLMRAKADSCHFWAEAISDYYYAATDSQLQLAHKHKSLRGRDLIRELTEEARAHGINVLAYTSAHSSWDFARFHPEDVMKGAEGNALAPSICFNSSLFLQLQKERSSYLLANYSIAGLFFDMMNFPFDKLACYCETCSRLFRDKYGFDLPKKPARDDSWEKFLEFRYETNWRFAHNLREHLRKQFPGRIICFNYHGHIPFEWHAGFQPVRHSTLSDATLAEDFASRFSQAYPSITSAFLAGVRPGSTFQLMTDLTLGGYGDFTQRPVADLKWDLFTGKMRGGNVMVIEKILHDYSLRPPVYEMIGEAFAEVKEKEPYFDHPALKEVGLYYSVRTRDWYDQFNSDAYERCIVGAYRALTDLHYQVEFLFDESADLRRLQEFPIIFLANTAILTNAEVERLRKYVSEGGSLLVTWETGLYDPQGRPQREFALADLLGVRYGEHLDQTWKTEFGEPDIHVEHWNFVRFSKGQWTADVHADFDLPVIGRPIVIKSDGANTFGELRTSLPGGRPPGTAGCSPWKTVGSALATNRFGKGNTAYFPVPLDCQYSTPRALPDHRNLIRNALRHVYSKREVVVQAPINVESVVMRGGTEGEFIVHLVGLWPRKNCKTHWLAPAPTTEIMEEPAIYRAKVNFAKPVRQARALSPSTSIRMDGHAITLQIEQVHEAVIVNL